MNKLPVCHIAAERTNPIAFAQDPAEARLLVERMLSGSDRQLLRRYNLGIQIHRMRDWFRITVGKQ
ncbi:MAG: hypothetical protein B7Z66_12195 [Chromatiales bacterium 21-64-14]|nr:MAG: hypothetical protein B7Z66_12195 [Chromatiales bacterium 21-64-14]HQU15477.1 hypothetical protein [Gammaproteobacteria bacterium]